MATDPEDDEPIPFASWRHEADLTQPELAGRLHGSRTHFTTVSKMEHKCLAYFRGKGELIDDWAQACNRDPTDIDVQVVRLRSGNAPSFLPGTERLIAAFASALLQLPRPPKPLPPADEAKRIAYLVKLVFPDLED